MSNVNYASNVSQRTPCVLVLDASSSMGMYEASTRKTRIDSLNEGLEAFYEALQKDEVALSRVQICVITAGGPTPEPEIVMDWTDANEFHPFKLTAGYLTPLGAATELAIETIEEHKTTLREYGISYTKPWLFIITDGDPTDDWESASELALEAEDNNKVEIWPIAVGNDLDLSELEMVSRKPPKRMSGIQFNELFVWLSASLGQVSRSVPGEKAKLPSTDPWADVSL